SQKYQKNSQVHEPIFEHRKAEMLNSKQPKNSDTISRNKIVVRVIHCDATYSKALSTNLRRLMPLHLINDIDMDYQLLSASNLDFFSVEIKRRNESKMVFTFAKNTEPQQYPLINIYNKVAGELCAEILKQIKNAQEDRFIAQLYY
ncbi:hypothetical protein BOX15_Mlig026775g1, partial [Macrostomum lignano]